MIEFITLSNTGYVDYTLNCLKSLSNIESKLDLHVYCIGKDGYEKFSDKKYKTTLIDDEQNSNFQKYRQGNWSNIVSKKFKIIHDSLLIHEYVCITDGDIVFENACFMDYLLENIGENDMLIQNDDSYDSSDRYVCSGFMFIKSNPNTLDIFNPVHTEPHVNKVNWGDQVYMNQIKNKLKYKKLPLALFPNGRYYYSNHKSIKPYLIHFNWLTGQEKKKTMVKYGKWYL